MVLVVVGCGPLDNRDLWGNAYPPECDRASLAQIEMPIVEGEMTGILAACVTCATEGAFILIDPRMNSIERTSAIEHEKCHRKMALLGKPINWHR